MSALLALFGRAFQTEIAKLNDLAQVRKAIAHKLPSLPVSRTTKKQSKEQERCFIQKPSTATRYAAASQIQLSHSLWPLYFADGHGTSLLPRPTHPKSFLYALYVFDSHQKRYLLCALKSKGGGNVFMSPALPSLRELTDGNRYVKNLL